MSISHEGYSQWTPHPSLGQTYPHAASHRPQQPPATKLLLVRLASKIQERTHSPWRLLQRTFFIRDKQTGVRTPEDLAKALEYVHVLLSPGDMRLLFDTFVAANGTFDFKAFAAALYPADDEKFLVKEGRKIPVPSAADRLDVQQEQKEQYQSTQAPPVEYHAIANPAEAKFAQSSVYIGSSDAHKAGRRQGTKRFTANDKTGLTASRIFGAQPQPKPVRVNELHTARSSSLLARAAAAQLAAAGSKHYRTEAQRAAAVGIVQPKGHELNKLMARVDFLNLSKYANASSRYERSQVSTQAPTQPYRHTAR